MLPWVFSLSRSFSCACVSLWDCRIFFFSLLGHLSKMVRNSLVSFSIWSRFAFGSTYVYQAFPCKVTYMLRMIS